METQKKNLGIWWLVFFASTIALISACYLHWEWLTLILPFSMYVFCESHGYNVITSFFYIRPLPSFR